MVGDIAEKGKGTGKTYRNTNGYRHVVGIQEESRHSGCVFFVTNEREDAMPRDDRPCPVLSQPSISAPPKPSTRPRPSHQTPEDGMRHSDWIGLFAAQIQWTSRRRLSLRCAYVCLYCAVLRLPLFWPANTPSRVFNARDVST